MYILLAVAGFIGLFWYGLWRLQVTAKAECDSLPESDTLIHRRATSGRQDAWVSRLQLNPLDELGDPRDVATLLMLETVQSNDDTATFSRERIADFMKAKFAFTDSEIEEAIVAVTYLRRQIPDLKPVLPDLVRPLGEMLTDAEAEEFSAFLTDIASDDESGADDFVGDVRTALGVS